MSDKERYIDQLVPLLQLTARTRGGKKAFLDEVLEQIGVKLPKSLSYKGLLKKIQEEDLEKEFCVAVFDTDSFQQAVSRYTIVSGLSLLSSSEILKVGEYLSDDRHTWRYNTSSGVQTILAIAEREPLDELNRDLSTMMSMNLIEMLTRQSKKWVLGPLGITQAVEYRNPGQAYGLRKLIEDELSNDILEEFLRQAEWLPSEVKLSSDKGNVFRRQELIQLSLTYGTTSDILSTFNKLISQGKLDIKTIRTFAWNIIGTPCGVFEKQYEGVCKLAKLIVEECSQDQLSRQLAQKSYFSSDVTLGAIEMCIKEHPVSVLNDFFGWAELMRIGNNVGLVRVETIPKSRLAEIISMRLGFELPMPIEGLTQVVGQVEKSEIEMNSPTCSKEESEGLMSGIYRALEVVLKDILQFYVGFLWPESVSDGEPGELREVFNHFCREKFGIDKVDGVDGLTLGELLQLLHKLNDVAKQESKLQENLKSQFQRKFVMSSKLLVKVEEGLKVRKYLAHDKGRGNVRSDATIKEFVKALEQIREFLQGLKKGGFYPHVIRVRREITDEFGRRYVEASDEDGKAWLIYSNEYLWPNEAYFMHTITNTIAVNPYLRLKIR